MFYVFMPRRIESPSPPRRRASVAALAPADPTHPVDADFENLITPGAKQKHAIQAYHDADRQSETRGLIARDLMTSPVLMIGPEETCSQAWALMKQKKIRHLLVSEHPPEFAGILSDRDLIGQAPLKKVKELMTTQVLTCAAETMIKDIAQVMLNHAISCLPIVNEKAEAIGILTQTDLLRHLIAEGPMNLKA